MSVLLSDLRYGLRTLRNNPTFTLVAVGTLALGIGANAAVFTVVNGVLLHPLPFRDQDRLFMLMERNPEGSLRLPSYPTFLDWQAQTATFADVAYVRGEEQRLTATDGVQSIIASFTSPGFFRILGQQALLGRLFGADEERSAAHVAVLSYDMWQTLFGGDPHILGKALQLSAGTFTVVGVLPHDVAYPPWTAAQVYLPLATIVATQRALAQRGFHADCRTVGRLKPGVSVEEATAKLGVVARREAAAYPEFNRDWTAARLIPLRDEILGNASPQLLVLLAAVGFVLLIACVNVANLTLARAGVRRRELAIRRALGAGRGRLVHQLLAESAVVACAGAVLGVVTATWAIVLLRRTAGGLLPRLDTVGLDPKVLAFAMAITLLTALATGLVPALRAAQADVADALQEGSGRAGTGRGPQRLRAALVTAEIALAVILVAGAGLLVKSLWRLAAVDPGFDPDALVTFYMAPPADQENPARLTALYQRVEEAARALPGVSGVALTNFTPLSSGWLPSPVEIPGRAPDPAHDPQVLLLTVSPEYFRVMGIPMRAGRDLTDGDLAGGSAILVNEAFARAFWAGTDPVGHAVTLHKAVQGRPDFGDPMPSTVVGVVGDVHHISLATPAEPQVYVPFTRTVWGHMTLVARTASTPAQLIATLRRTVRRVAPELPLTLAGGSPALATVNVGAALRSRRFSTYLLAGFAASALLLAALGVYGLVAYTVAQRRREIGVRVALGARGADVLRLVVGGGMRLVAAGLAVGVTAALLLARLLRALLYGVGASDPATFVAVAALLGLVALGACYVPARHAARTDPMEALRCE